MVAFFTVQFFLSIYVSITFINAEPISFISRNYIVVYPEMPRSKSYYCVEIIDKFPILNSSILCLNYYFTYLPFCPSSASEASTLPTLYPGFSSSGTVNLTSVNVDGNMGKLSLISFIATVTNRNVSNEIGVP